MAKVFANESTQAWSFWLFTLEAATDHEVQWKEPYTQSHMVCVQIPVVTSDSVLKKTFQFLSLHLPFC
jgi:hypothetical protein